VIPTDGPVEIVVGAPVHRAGAHVLDKFLANQKAIQDRRPSSRLVLATVEPDLADELDTSLAGLGIKGRVLRYETVRPGHARSRIWNISCGRDAIRRHVLAETDARYLLCADADMTYDPDILQVMEREIQGYDAVYSGAPLRDFGLALCGGGCCMLRTEALKELEFRCLEFRNGTVLTEDTMLEFDLISLRRRIKRGFFVALSHYVDEREARSISPHPLGLYLRVTHSTPVRYALIRASVLLRRDVGSLCRRALERLRHPRGWRPVTR
jgi:hypothetical protein